MAVTVASEPLGTTEGAEMIPVVCPTCNYTGTGWASIKGATCAAGICPDCMGAGEVTPTKRERLLAQKAQREEVQADR
jgi:DnaJ-class molecular chaperone